MSSVRSLFASSTIAAVERRLRSVGRVADDNSSAAFAVKPASAAQDPELDASPPDDPVIIADDVTHAVEAAQTAPATSPDARAANGTIPPAPGTCDVTSAAQAAHAYARVMQAWLATKASRPAAPEHFPTKPNTHTER
jgi:hypothetical protein